MASNVKKMENLNRSYINEFFKQHGLNKSKLGSEMGCADSYISMCLSRGTMGKTELLFLCDKTGVDYEKATSTEKPVKDCGSDMAEIIVSYIQDVGKIQDDTRREVRETKAMLKETLDKLNNTLHDLDVFLRNSGAEARTWHVSTNNTMQAMTNTLKGIHSMLQSKK